jgi:hypothetical protein
MDYDGPFKVIDKLRHAIQTRAWDCFFCLSVWTAVPFALYLTDGIDIVIYVLGLSGAAWFVNLIHERWA